LWEIALGNLMAFVRILLLFVFRKVCEYK